MSETFGRIKNYNVSVKKLKDNVLFLRKLVPGGSEHKLGNTCSENGRHAAAGTAQGE